MSKLKRITALLLVLVLAASCTGCSKSGEKMKEWFNGELTEAYDGYIASPDAETAVSPSISLLVASSAYINAVFDYMQDGTQPEEAEITYENGVYTYKATYFKQVIEIDTKTPCVRVEMLQEYMGESRTDFITVITENGGEYFVQQLLPEFGEYYEIRFTAEGGSTAVKTDCYEMPYSIFEGDIPENFAKEN